MKALVVALVLLAAPRAFAQESDWEPLGQLPVDQAGAGRRGYVLAAEGADVAPPGTHHVSLHFVAANNFYREANGGLLISDRHETHTFALGYRRGFSTRGARRLEFGAQVQIHQRDAGFLNGFIAGFEDFWVALTRHEAAKNELRERADLHPPLGTFVSRRGQSLYEAAGGGTGFGDAQLMVKALLRDSARGSSGARVAVQGALNLSGRTPYTMGNFAGAGLSLDKRLVGWAAFHGDARVSLLLDRKSAWALPLKRTTVAYSVGPELRLTTNSSLGVRIDGASSPYRETGTIALDVAYGAVTLGFSHRLRLGGREWHTQLYARENMNWPASVRWNADPDLAVGLKVGVRAAR